MLSRAVAGSLAARTRKALAEARVKRSPEPFHSSGLMAGRNAWALTRPAMTPVLREGDSLKVQGKCPDS